MAKKITEEDLGMIRYFWEEKQDPTRWVGWDRVLPDLQKEHPAILGAWENWKAAAKIMSSVIEDALETLTED